jgi:hypothetical protein
MQTPELNADGYNSTTLLNKAKNLKIPILLGKVFINFLKIKNLKKK